MSTYLNPSRIPLSLAVFLATDNYDYESNTISATGLIRPLRQIVLARRVPADQRPVEIGSLVKSRIGSALHDGIERAWIHNKDQAMEALGYPEHVIQRVKVNPEPDELEEGDIPVYLEKRSRRQVGRYVVSGKFDFVAEGRVEDFKSTGTFSWTNERASKDKELSYKLQGSIYRWLNPDIITDDELAINFIFTDWSYGFAKANPNYPPEATAQKLIPLMSISETDNWIRQKLDLLDQYLDAPESEIPLCTDADLWRSAPEFKYYKNPDKRNRSTKNFDNYADAFQRLQDDGGTGVVIEKPGTVSACKYCPAFAVCTQKDDLLARGELQM